MLRAGGLVVVDSRHFNCSQICFVQTEKHNARRQIIHKRLANCPIIASTRTIKLPFLRATFATIMTNVNQQTKSVA